MVEKTNSGDSSSAELQSLKDQVKVLMDLNKNLSNKVRSKDAQLKAKLKELAGVQTELQKVQAENGDLKTLIMRS